MALNSADQLRFYLSDRPRQLLETKYGDGTASAFQLSGVPLVTGGTAFGAFQPSAYVPIGAGGGTAWTATGATFNLPLGVVSFNNSISAQSAYQVKYTYASFSDLDMDFITGMVGDMFQARLLAIDNLMADSYKRASWGVQRGAFYNDQETMKNLMLMREAVYREMTIEQGPLGDVISWDEQQQNFG